MPVPNDYRASSPNRDPDDDDVIDDDLDDDDDEDSLWDS